MSKIHTTSKCVFESRLSLRSCSLTWNIHDFSRLSATSTSPMLSPVFSTDTDEFWQLEIFKDHSINEWEEVERFVSLNIVPLTPRTSSIYIWGEVSVLIYEQKHLTSRRKHERVEKGKRYGLWFSLMNDVEELLENRGQQIDVLSLCCRIDAWEDAGISSSDVHKKVATGLGSNLPNLTHKFSDVRIEVMGRVFQSHKIILAANSPVFEAMFEEGTKEQKDNHVLIKDIDSGVFEVFLHFLYCGEVDRLDEMLSELFAVADKYDVQPLRKVCVEHMSKKISVDNASEILALAEQYTMKKIKQLALKFIEEHFNDVVITDSWASLIKNYPKVAKEASVISFPRRGSYVYKK